MRLIVKADDYGSTKKITDGIIESMQEGIVRDTSFLVNSPHFDYAVKRANEENITAMGLHLALTYRGPILPAHDVPSLVDTSGMFYGNPREVDSVLKIEELEKEWRAQVDKFQSSGLILTHIDTHHHVHMYLQKEVGELAIKLAGELNVPIRRPRESQLNLLKEYDMKTTDVFIQSYGGSDDNSTPERLLNLLEEYKDFDGTIEIMSHPGYSDNELRSLSSWNDCREKEIETFKNPKVLKYIKDNNIILINFDQL